MKRTYLVKKDPEREACEDNWIIMDGREFCRFLETEEGKKRKDCFERVEAAG